MERRRVQAAAMFDKGTSAPEVGRSLGVSRQVAYRWKAAWEKGGKAGSASEGKAGRKSKLTAVQTERVVKALPGKPTVILDGAPIHWSRMVQDYLASTGGHIVVERLPAYAPELNPVEYMWGNLKTHQIGNLIAPQAWELSMAVTAALRRMRRRRSIIAACYKQSTLWPE